MSALQEEISRRTLAIVSHKSSRFCGSPDFNLLRGK